MAETLDLSAYLPMDRRAALAEGRALPEKATGTALLADISGFTPMADYLVQQHGQRRGAEMLSAQLERVYEVLVSQVDVWGGSVVGFSGDGMTCWFDGGEGSAHPAAACALAMLSAMHGLSSISEGRLEIKVSLASGAARRFVVGDPEIQLLDVLVGEPLRRAAAGEEAAEAGEIMLDESTSALLGADLASGGERLVDGRTYRLASDLAHVPEVAARQSLPSLPPEVVRAWLLPTVWQRLQHRQRQFQSELRPAIAMFVHFGGIDWDNDPAAGPRLDAYIRWVQALLNAAGGSLLGAVMGEKGDFLNIAFGAPVAHEDDAIQAIHTALQLGPEFMRQPPAHLAYIQHVRIGMSMGAMRSGAYGSPLRRAYSLLGDEVNLASRLMQHAQDGEVLASGRLYAASRQFFRWRAMPAMELKGKRAAIPVYAVLQTEPQAHPGASLPGSSFPLIGRQSELQRLNEWLDEAERGVGRVTAISGAPGIGKSRLADEALALAQQKGFAIYRGAGQPYGQKIPYLAWKTAWEQFYGLDAPGAETTPALQAALEQLDPGLTPRAPLLSPLLGIEIPDTALTNGLPARLRKTLLENLLLSCLRLRQKQLGQPLLLVIEDIHWLDPLSIDLLRAIAWGSQADAISLLVICRSAFQNEALPSIQTLELEKLRNFGEIKLDELEDAEALLLLRQRLPAPTNDPAQVETARRLSLRLAEIAQGNPFYLEELANFVRQQRSGLESLELPDSLHRLILSRIDQLSEREQAILRVASIVGQRFPLGWLEALHSDLAETEAVCASLARLSEVSLVTCETMSLCDPADTIYAFKHVVTREVVYESMPYITRSRLHEQLARFLERQVDAQALPSVPELVNLIATHYGQTRNTARQRAYFLQAAELAEASYANQTAIEYYQRLLELAQGAEAVQILQRMAAILDLVGNWKQARERLEDAAARLRPLVEAAPGSQAQARQQAGVWLALGNISERLGAYEAGREWLEQARRSFENLGQVGGVSQALEAIGRTHYRQGNFAAARPFLEQALALARRADDLAARAQALLTLGSMINFSGDTAAARPILQENLVLWQEMNDRPRVAEALNHLGNLERNEGNYQTARTIYEKVLAQARELGDQDSIATAIYNLGVVAQRSGDEQQATILYRESLALHRNLRNPLSLGFALNSLGFALARQGDIQSAADLFRESLGVFAQVRNRRFISDTLAALAALACLLGQHTAGVQAGAAAVQQLKTDNSRLYVDAQPLFERGMAAARQALGEAAFEQARQAGEQLSLEQAAHLLG